MQDNSRIKLLPQQLANQIAAGEVVERPASVLKECLENSLDAGSTKILIEIEQGGTSFIRITDNGIGIHPDDLEFALMQHATSKLNTVDDLHNIQSHGFRGEALASIASVSRLTLASRQTKASMGTEIRSNLEGNSRIRPRAMCPGTIIEISELFYNIPARRRYLRSIRTEWLQCFDIVKRLALAHPHVDFDFQHNDTKRIIWRGSSPEARLEQIFGRMALESIFQLEANQNAIKVFGWVQEPSAKLQLPQYFFINQRIVKDKLITHAIRRVLIEQLQWLCVPGYMLNLEIDPCLVDINVHPAKLEVRFGQPILIHGLIETAFMSMANKMKHFVHQDKSEDHLGAESYRFAKGIEHEIDIRNSEVLDVISNRYIVGRYQGQLAILDGRKLMTEQLRTRWENSKITCRVHLKKPILVPLSEEYHQKVIKILAKFGFELSSAGPKFIAVRAIPNLIELDGEALKTCCQIVCHDALNSIDPFIIQSKLLAYLTERKPLNKMSATNLMKNLHEGIFQPHLKIGRILTESELAELI